MPAAHVCGTGAGLYPDQHMNRPISHLAPGQHVITRGAWHQGLHVPVELSNPKGFVYGDLIDPVHVAAHEHKE